MISEELLNATEARYVQRQQERAAIADQLACGGIAQANPPEQVRRRLARVGVEPPPAATTRAILAPQEGMAPSDPTLERILGNNDLLGVAYLDIAARATRAVGCVRIRQQGRSLGSGTGFLIAPHLLMTNNHVLSCKAMASESFVEFDYQDDADGVRRHSILFDLDPETFFLTDQALDYTVTAVKPIARDGQTALCAFGWLPLSADDAKVLNGEPLNIIQHPNGEPKQLALRANDLIDSLEQFLHYQTDTAPGSSGSPVFNDEWTVVALHHSGVPKRDEEGHILKRGGGQWLPEMGEQWIDWSANEGVRISRLLPHLQQQAQLTNQAVTLQKELVAANHRTAQDASLIRQPLLPSEGNPSASTLPPNGTQLAPPASVTVTGAVATWTIPLQISVQLGQPIGQAAVQPTVQPPVQPVSKPPQPAVTSLAQQELQAALAELAAAPTRLYYDAQRDAQDQVAYYGTLTDALTPEERFHALHQLLSRTTGQIPKYAPGRQLYPWIDLHQDCKIRSIYSNREYDPQALIEDDFRIVEQRAVRMNELLRNEAALNLDDLAAEFDALEAALPYNCEHVVCQSWFAKKEPIRGDLHHLFACEAGCNSFRGNTPYFDFPDYLEVIRGDCGKLEGERFEPGNGKGKVARATLYFLLCYPGKINSVMSIYNEDRLQTLLDWHKQFPVTEHEKHRNMSIFQRQGNRNPLIDYPEWATQIDFRLGL